MEKIIQDVIKTAIKLEEEAMGTYLIDAQVLSGFSDKVFFDLLETEIQRLNKGYSFPDVFSLNILNHVDYLNQHLHRRDIFEFQRGYHSISLKIEALNSSLNQILQKNKSRSPETLMKKPSSEEMKLFLSKLKSEKIENHFNAMTVPLAVVIDLFQPLIQDTNSEGEVWMTHENFEFFIRRSFGHELQNPKPKIKLGRKGVYAIVKLFYLFYSYCFEEDYLENKSVDPFVELLKNAFDTSKFAKIGENFKGSKSQYEWF